MRGKHKKFEQDVYDKCDGPGKAAVEKHLILQGHTVVVPEENYGPDLYTYFFDRKCFHEVEVSLQWKADVFPFLNGSIPERKSRLLTKVGNCELFFWMLRKDLHRAVVIPSTMLLDEYLVEVPNYKIKSGEYFYRVPLIYGKEFALASLGHG